MSDASASTLTRRSFVMAAGVAAAGTVSGAARVAHAGEVAVGAVSAAPESWDVEADIVIVGCGGAGLAAGITAADEGLGDAIILEAAPEGYEGGNFRVSAQVIFCPDDVDGAIEYQTNLNGLHKVNEKYLRAWAENLTQNIDWLQSQGIKTQETAFFNPEWPDVKGSEHCHCYLAGEEMGFGMLWDAMWSRAQELGIKVQWDTRVVGLVTDRETGEVLGVRDDAGKTYKARKGVLLACGGFENDRDMVANYFQIGYSECRPMGTPYNRGDGIKMAQSVGADLWHMNNFSNSGYGLMSAGEDDDMKSIVITQWPGKDYIYVGPDGTRFMYEETQSLARHGKMLTAGNATNAAQPAGSWCVFGSDTFNSDQCVFQQDYICQWNIQYGLAAHHTNQEYLDAGQIVTGDTPEELAEAMGMDPEALANTINSYNENAANNEDPDFKRGTDVYSAFNYGEQGESANAGKSQADNGGGDMEPSIRSFDLVPLKPPYYAVHMYTCILNTQGGPRRDVDGSVMRFDGTDVPRLYAAGELGTVYAYNYNGGGNVSEAISSGRLAARSIGALEAWE
jgi:succinate dehydrogenase/fumarate reductase flavoprotein subunit